MTRSQPVDGSGSLVRRVAAFRNRRIAVLGDLVADEFVHGEIARVSREAPVLILEHRRTDVVLGGAGNAVANLRALGAEPFPVGVVGRDDAGDALLEMFRKIGVRTGGVLRTPGYATPAKSRIVAGGVHTRRQQVVRVDRGARHGALPAALLGPMMEKLRASLRRAEGLLVADYGYGVAPPELVRRVLRQAGRRNLPVLVDSRTRVERFTGVTACTPNQEELERAAGGGPLAGEAAVVRAGTRLLEATGNRAVLVTRGARGMTLFEPGREPVYLPAFGSEEVADVTGAGDTVIATFTLAALAGAGFVDAARLANVAAGLVVMKAGTATVTPSELGAAIARQEAERAAPGGR